MLGTQCRRSRQYRLRRHPEKLVSACPETSEVGEVTLPHLDFSFSGSPPGAAAPGSLFLRSSRCLQRTWWMAGFSLESPATVPLPGIAPDCCLSTREGWSHGRWTMTERAYAQLRVVRHGHSDGRVRFLSLHHNMAATPSCLHKAVPGQNAAVLVRPQRDRGKPGESCSSVL